MRGRLILGPAVVGALLVAACGGPAGTPIGTIASAPSATPAVVTTPITATVAPQSTGMATFQLSLTGDASVTGDWSTGTGINCSNPTLAGLNILAFANSADGQVVMVVTVSEGSVDVSERAGSGATYVSREFRGTGVTGYDPARGATIDSDVTEVPIAGVSAGTLGAVSHVKGTIACNGQTTGASTVVLSGSSAEGPVTGAFTQFRVVCGDSARDGLSVTIIAVIVTTTPPVYLITNLPGNGNATIFTITDTPKAQHSYAIDKSTIATVSATGAHLDASFVEVLAAGSVDTPHVLHETGDVTCGTFSKT